MIHEPIATETLDVLLGDFRTEGGQTIPQARVRVRTWGDPALGRQEGWSLVIHALTGSADADRWWEGVIGPGQPLDTTQRPAVAMNLLGSCYGSSGPCTPPFDDGISFPRLTTADLARAQVCALQALGVERLALVTGASLGGMVALQLGRLSPMPIDHLVVFAAPARTSPQAIAWNVAQRMAIEADPRWRDGSPRPDDPPAAGLAAARAIAMITYRSKVEFDERFARARHPVTNDFQVDRYLRRHGEKLVERFDARSYVLLTHAMDSHSVGDYGQAAAETARRVRRVTGVGVDTDILYAAGEVRAWVAAYRGAGVNADYREITSPCGHDAFLIELDQVQRILAG
ncbi:MAG: homoserine O-acetyltransferase [Gemmatimonadaceae bacterium]|nr:homoserine O-acetyltransferase [Gemmatimonadaceae bacterium]